MADLAKAEGQITQSQEELVKAAHAVALQTLRAPIDGTVQQLAVHTVGRVVTPSEALLRVVPDNAGLVIDARVANSDIGFVHAGERAEIKVEAFPFTRYGLIHGTVIGVSRDAVGNQGANPPPPAKPGDTAANKGSVSPPADGSPGYTARIALGRTTMTTEAGRNYGGNGRAQTFFGEADYARYRDLLAQSCRAAGVAVWAWVLMPNHVHLILVPGDADGLRRALAPVHRRYAGEVHARAQRTGHFWQGRFGAVAMDEDHLAAALRYVALNSDYGDRNYGDSALN